MSKRFSPYVLKTDTVTCIEGGLAMEKAGTHFEQVPKNLVENILARQNTQMENELAENDGVAKPDANKVETPSLLSPGGGMAQQKTLQQSRDRTRIGKGSR
jgi:hypothetical protein